MSPRRFALVGAALAAALVVAASPAGAAPAVQTTTDPAKAAAGWLAQRFVGAAHTPSPSGDHLEAKYSGQYYFDGGTTADAIFALSAAKAGKDRIDAAIAYLAAHVAEYTSISDTSGKPGPYDGSVAKAALAAIVAGADPRHFGGYDLIQALQQDECTSVSLQTTDYTVPNCPAIGAARNVLASPQESFVILAESRAGVAPSAAAMKYFLTLQCADGGFTVDFDTTKGCSSDLDSTSYAAAALQAAGGQSAALTKALDWLASQRGSNGAWSAQGGPNVDSTGLAVSVLGANGRNVSASRAWLASQQVTVGVTLGPTASRGALKYQGAYNPSASVKATADGLMGLASGASFTTLTAQGATPFAPVLAPTETVGRGSLAQGAQQTATGIGFNAGEKVRASVHSSAPVTVGTVTAAADGTAKVAFTVPATLPVGSHTVELTGLTSGLTASAPFTVTRAPAASVAPASTPTPTPTLTQPATSSSAPYAATTPQLAATGTESKLELIVAGTLVGVGALAVVAGRRRRT